MYVNVRWCIRKEIHAKTPLPQRRGKSKAAKPATSRAPKKHMRKWMRRAMICLRYSYKNLGFSMFFLTIFWPWQTSRPSWSACGVNWQDLVADLELADGFQAARCAHHCVAREAAAATGAFLFPQLKGIEILDTLLANSALPLRPKNRLRSGNLLHRYWKWP